MSIEEIRRLITTHAHKEDLGLPGVRINRITDPTQPTPSIAEPILAFSMQGAKRIALADRVYDQVPGGAFMTVAVDLPITATTFELPVPSPTSVSHSNFVRRRSPNYLWRRPRASPGY